MDEWKETLPMWQRQNYIKHLAPEICYSQQIVCSLTRWKFPKIIPNIMQINGCHLWFQTGAEDW